MSPTSRNTLMIGGALILIALLLVCGPLSGRFGGGGSTVEEPPSVAAGPPVDAGAALGAAASGAMAGARLGEVGADGVAATTNDDPCSGNRNGADRDGKDCPPLAGAGVAGAGTTVSDAGVGAGALVAGTAVAAGAATAAATSGNSGGGSGSANANSAASPPPVSAGVPSTPASSPGGVPAIVAGVGAAAASGVFDDAVASARNQNGGVSPAGRIVDRFAPPVAAPLDSGMRVASALQNGPMILPCDSPGSGCRNISAGGGGGGGGGGLNPPIIPGGRPPSPIRNNPPIVPGVRPPQIP